jgi:maltooligosyltrehalose synthase
MMGFEMAWAFLERAAQFLKKKEAIREAEGRAYWDSPEGKARREEILGDFVGSLVHWISFRLNS